MSNLPNRERRGRKRRSRKDRLRRELKKYQEDDTPIAPFMMTSIKYVLKFSGAVFQVEIREDMFPHGFKTTLPENVPTFISSQLEAQNIADLNRLPVQMVAAVILAKTHLSEKPTTRHTYPTLFCSYHAENHRTYYVYAYLRCSMDPHIYRIHELLELRNRFSFSVLGKLRGNSEVADLVKDKDTMRAIQHTLSEKANEDNEDASSSTGESDVILFKGKRHKSAAAWNYRGRSEAQGAKTQPIGAPAGADAQKSEGFQRFFKAVASPTHVRVTAGGRIVPNTRGSVSPTAKWDGDRTVVVEQESAEPSKDEKPKASIGAPQLPPMYPPPYPLHPPVFQHMGLQMPVFPIPQGVPMGYGASPYMTPQMVQQPIPTQMVQQPILTQMVQQPISTQSERNMEESAKAAKTDGADDKKPRPVPVNFQPPNQLGQNVSFFHNGQLMVPAAFAPPPTQMQVIAPGQYIPQGMGGLFPSLHSVHPSSAGNPPPPQFAPAPMPPPAMKRGAAPHITSIRPSDVTKRQIDSLRENLKYYEDQLQYNRHQIDEKGTAEKLANLRQSLGQFEGNYKQQLNFEATYYPQPTAVDSAPKEQSWKTPSQASSTRSRRGPNTSQASSVSGRSGSRAGSTKAVGLNSSKGATTPFATDTALERLILDKMRKGAGSQMSRSEAAQSGEQAGLLPPAPGFTQGHLSQPYLVGTLRQGLASYIPQATDYVYSRELTDEEKKARSYYWDHVQNAGSGLPKYDGKNFYPPSPVKATGTHQYGVRHSMVTGRSEVSYAGHVQSAENDPFRSSRSTRGIRSQEGGPRLSKAIPIVAPGDAGHRAGSKAAKFSSLASQVGGSTEGLSKNLGSMTISSSEGPAGENQDKASRRGLERSSTKSGYDLWQTMLKRTSASGSVLPSAVSSTTATGYLPPFNGHAAASLGPAISNTSNYAARTASEAGDKPVEYETPQLTSKKVGENRPPNETRSADSDPMKEVHQLMLRDAERRGVIGSDW
ncbi:hypothetical protein F4677DRAFT_461907 [Hypoxylon crocopeplum]|nr:hypothetical protein F4677DRAFT_461907 [Hypoxylon crocopeplum]